MNVAKTNVAKVVAAVAAAAKLVRISVRQFDEQREINENFLFVYIDNHLYYLSSLRAVLWRSNPQQYRGDCFVGEITLLAMTETKGEQNDSIPHPHP